MVSLYIDTVKIQLHNMTVSSRLKPTIVLHYSLDNLILIGSTSGTLPAGEIAGVVVGIVLFIVALFVPIITLNYW